MRWVVTFRFEDGRAVGCICGLVFWLWSAPRLGLLVAITICVCVTDLGCRLGVFVVVVLRALEWDD